MTGIAGALVSNGIVNSDNRNETTKKERLGEKTYEQQNSINVTKLNAYLRGENPDDVKNSLKGVNKESNNLATSFLSVKSAILGFATGATIAGVERNYHIILSKKLIHLWSR